MLSSAGDEVDVYSCKLGVKNFFEYLKVDEERLLVFTSPSRVSTVRTTMLLFTCASGVSLVSKLVSTKHTHTQVIKQRHLIQAGINNWMMNHSPLNCKLVKFCTGTVILEEVEDIHLIIFEFISSNYCGWCNFSPLITWFPLLRAASCRWQFQYPEPALHWADPGTPASVWPSPPSASGSHPPDGPQCPGNRPSLWWNAPPSLAADAPGTRS